MKVVFVIAALFAVAFAQKDAVVVSEDPLFIDPDGHFHHSFKADNGIEILATRGSTPITIGNFKYTSPEGEIVELEYVADAENGFVPTGSHIPVPPEIPLPIARALEYIAAHPPTDPAQGAYVPDV